MLTAVLCFFSLATLYFFFFFFLKIALLPAGVLQIIIFEHNRCLFPAIWRVAVISAEASHYFCVTVRLWKSVSPHLPYSLPANTGWLARPLLWCRRLYCLWTFILDVKFYRIITRSNSSIRPCSTLLCCQGESIENYAHSSACAVWAPWI